MNYRLSCNKSLNFRLDFGIEFSFQLFEPAWAYRRVEHSKDGPYDKETFHPRLSS